MTEQRAFYHDGMRALQDRFDGRRVADSLAEHRRRWDFWDDDRVMIENSAILLHRHVLWRLHRLQHALGHARFCEDRRPWNDRIPRIRRQLDVSHAREHQPQSECRTAVREVRRQNGPHPDQRPRRQSSTTPTPWPVTTRRSWSCGWNASCFPIVRARCMIWRAAACRPICRGRAMIPLRRNGKAETTSATSCRRQTRIVPSRMKQADA